MIRAIPRTTLFGVSKRWIETGASTVDPHEMKVFQNSLDSWCDPYGSMKALHSMNKLRVPFIRDGLVNTHQVSLKLVDSPNPLKELKVLDVGCGGGILSVPLARLGADVTGLDANPDMIKIAEKFAEKSKLKINLQANTIEEHAMESPQKYDAIVASEIIEHVSNKEKFLKGCVDCLKPNGSIFLTTVNKTLMAGFVNIFMGEYVLNILPKGTHQMEKFIEPNRLRSLLEDVDCKTMLLHGMAYNFLTNSWSWCDNQSICYALHAVKMGENSDEKKNNIK